MVQFNVALVTLYMAVVALGLVLKLYTVGSAADTVALFVSIVVFLYAIMKMR